MLKNLGPSCFNMILSIEMETLNKRQFLQSEDPGHYIGQSTMDKCEERIYAQVGTFRLMQCPMDIGNCQD